jgi:HK97 family phage major capsid protein/HK97 family phage prohead protease
MLLKADFTVTKALEDEETGVLTIRGSASTDDKDRAGDIVLASAWQEKSALANYIKNPIILAYHDHTRPIGKAVEITPTPFGLDIAAEISPADKQAYDLVKAGILTTFSIGFRINDAEYHEGSDTFLIKAVELHEISVVSVPCNQDCTFSVAKSLEAQENLQDLKSKFKTIKEPKMDPKEQEAAIAKAVAAELAKRDAEAAVEAAKAAKAAEAEKAIAAAKAEAKAEAERLVADIEKRAAEKNTANEDKVKSLMETIAEFKGQLEAQQEEVKAVIAQRHNRIPEGPMSNNPELNKDIENAVLLGIILKKGTFDTKYGTQVKASALPSTVNTSGSGEVSSAAYEATFSTNLQRDIQDLLVFKPLFGTIPMTSANLILPISPNAAKAGWVGAATYGTTATSGSEVDSKLTEINLRTYKLAGHSFLPDELEEDTIIPMLPLIRRYLVEAMAHAIDATILLSDGSTGDYANTFKGLVTLASEGTSKVVTTTADSATKVTAAMIRGARRKLGKRGRNARDIICVVSQEAYYDLLEDSEYQDVQQVGPAVATKINGEVGSLSGIRIIVSDRFVTPGNAGVYAVLLDVTNFLVPEQRGLTIELERSARAGLWTVVATQRLGFNQIIAGEGVVTLTYAATYTAV